MVGTNSQQQYDKKYFSIKEAERMLPKIQKYITRAITLNQALDLLSSIEIEVYDDDHENLQKVTKLNKQFHKLSYEFYDLIERLEEMGCLIKDLEMGVVDFHSIFEGKEIFLCWKLGETSIQFWHEIEEEFAGRRPLKELFQKK